MVFIFAFQISYSETQSTHHSWKALARATIRKVNRRINNGLSISTFDVDHFISSLLVITSVAKRMPADFPVLPGKFAT
jgi:hypothetical protein